MKEKPYLSWRDIAVEDILEVLHGHRLKK